MYQSKTSGLRVKITRFLISAFTLITFALLAGGCATNITGPANLDTAFVAENTEEGIRLSFSNIPPETARIFIHIQRFVGDDKDNINANDFFASFSNIRGSALEQVKQTGIVNFPFVKAGHEYTVSIIIQNRYFDDLTEWLHATITPFAGIYVVNDVQLKLNDTNSALTLSAEPVFSSDVTFARQKFGFGVSVSFVFSESLSGSLGIGEQHFPGGLSSDGLSWTFEPHFFNVLRDAEYLEKDSYPASGRAYSRMIYDNLTWYVQIARTPEFVYYL